MIGKPLDRVDGRQKVTGGARYAAENKLDRRRVRRRSSPAPFRRGRSHRSTPPRRRKRRACSPSSRTSTRRSSTASAAEPGEQAGSLAESSTCRSQDDDDPLPRAARSPSSSPTRSSTRCTAPSWCASRTTPRRRAPTIEKYRGRSQGSIAATAERVHERRCRRRARRRRR